MAHFAKVKDGVVTQVIVAEADFFDTFVDSEPGEWIQTSYNTRGGQHYDPETGEVDDGTPLRKNYAGIGFTYDRDRDAFIPPQPFASWTLNDDSCLWESPIAYPDDDAMYAWDEDAYQADNTTGWVLVPEEEGE
jgi:hypothetical protein